MDSSVRRRCTDNKIGNGISHAEEIDDKSKIFQIWFDPDLSKSLQKSFL